jgi:hypothetical protein
MLFLTQFPKRIPEGKTTSLAPDPDAPGGLAFGLPPHYGAPENFCSLRCSPVDGAALPFHVFRGLFVDRERFYWVSFRSVTDYRQLTCSGFRRGIP